MQSAIYSEYRSDTFTKSPSEKEADIILHITRDLKAADENKGVDYPSFIEALSRNKQMWQVFFIDVANEKNQLPESLRAQIAYLADFVNDYSTKLLREEVDIKPLIDINQSIIRGLTGYGVR